MCRVGAARSASQEEATRSTCRGGRANTAADDLNGAVVAQARGQGSEQRRIAGGAGGQLK
jgi:hypothetical protein